MIIEDISFDTFKEDLFLYVQKDFPGICLSACEKYFDLADQFESIRVIGAIKDGKAVGAAPLAVSSDFMSSAVVCSALHVYIIPKERVNGVLDTLIDEIERWSEDMGCTHVTLNLPKRIEKFHDFEHHYNVFKKEIK